MAEDLDEPAVARRARVGYDEPVRRLFLGAHAAQSDFNHVRAFMCVWESSETFRRGSCGMRRFLPPPICFII